MSTLYIANTTKQHHIFTYRHPEKPGLRRMPVKAGTQIKIGDVTPDQIDIIVKQYELYGIRDAREMSRLSGYIGFSYSVDKPVPIDAMLIAFAQNDQALAAQGQERLVLEAAEVSNSIAKDLATKGGRAQSEEEIEKLRPDVEVRLLEENTTSDKPVNIGIEAPRDRKPHKARAA